MVLRVLFHRAEDGSDATKARDAKLAWVGTGLANKLRLVRVVVRDERPEGTHHSILGLGGCAQTDTLSAADNDKNERTARDLLGGLSGHSSRIFARLKRICHSSPGRIISAGRASVSTPGGGRRLSRCFAPSPTLV